MERIIIGKIEAYQVNRIREFLEKGLDDIGLEYSNKKVLLKPNLLSGNPPEKAITTHPAVVDAISGILKDHSCDVYIGDSPGYESTARVLKKAGYTGVISRHNLKVSLFDKKIEKRYDGISPYREFLLGDDPDGYDLIINIPKLKSHTMMSLTLGVKNTFGFIHRLEKAKWHLRAGKDREIFARVLIDIHRIVHPDVTILDGITGMDGDGPSNGRVRDFGIMGISKDAFILDHYIERMIGLSQWLPVTNEALRNSLVKEYDIVAHGNPEIDDFLMPQSMATDWNIPGRIKGFLRGFFIKKPRLKKDICEGCRICMKVCPANAINFTDNIPVFDYNKCIRCYCCQEMCPNGAIKV